MQDFMMESAEFTADEKTIVTGARSHARLWDAETGEALGDPIPKTGMFRLSPDGKWIVGKLDQGVRIIDPATGGLLADEMIHARHVGSVEFSPDGHRFVTTAGDSAVIWETRPFGRQLPEWLLRLVDAVSLERLNENDVFEALAEEPSQILSGVQEKISRDPIDDEWVKWARWFLADKSNRTISPISPVTVPRYIENRIKENTAESLDEVEQLAVGNAELQDRISAARAALSQSHR
jgi:WD40 repeat protein